MPNKVKVFGSKKINRPKQGSQNWWRSPLPVWGEQLSFYKNYKIWYLQTLLKNCKFREKKRLTDGRMIPSGNNKSTSRGINPGLVLTYSNSQTYLIYIAQITERIQKQEWYSLTINLILYLFNEDCRQPMATSGFPVPYYCLLSFYPFILIKNNIM